jgi:phenylacetate-CoA ligase
MLIDRLERAYYSFRRWVPARVLYHPAYFDVLSLLEKCEDGELLDRAIAARIRFILSEAVTQVPFYRESVKLTAEEIKRSKKPVELLQFFPFLEKETVMNQQDRFLSDRYRKKQIYYVTSGGSSGQGIGLWRNKRVADIEKAFFSWERERFGFSLERSRYLRIGADARREAGESPVWNLGNQLMLSPYHVNEQWRNEILRRLNEYKPEFINAYPSSLYELAKLIESDQLDFRPRAIFLASEPVLDYQLAKIFDIFSAPISFNYGLTERTNLAFAEYREGVKYAYRMNHLYGYSENRYINGQFEIVGTSLWNDVMPLIRYCTADFGLIGENGELDDIDGRAQEFLVDKTGNRIPGLSIVIDEPTWDFVKYYQVRQSQVGVISVLLVPKHGSLSEEQRKYVLNNQQKRWGGFFDISVREVDDIPLTSGGKRRLVVSDIKDGRSFENRTRCHSGVFSQGDRSVSGKNRASF